MSHSRRGRHGVLLTLLSVALIWALLPVAATAQESLDDAPLLDERAIVTLHIPNQTALVTVVDRGFDLDHNLERIGDGYTVTAFVTPDEADELEALGVAIDVEATPAEVLSQHEALLAEREAAVASGQARAAAANVDEVDTVVIARADTFTNSNGSRSISVEAKTSDSSNTSGANPVLTLRWFDADDEQIGQQNLSPFIDAGEYQYHRLQVNNVPVRPAHVSVTSANGGYAEKEIQDWLGPIGPGRGNRYYEGFFDHYLNAYEFNEFITDLAEEYPDLAEIVELPYLTNGYRRHAQALLGDTNANRVGITSHAYGSEGGDEISIETADPGTADSSLTVAVTDQAIKVTLATDTDGAVVSTAAEVVAAINGNASAAALAEAYTYRGNAGTGVVPVVAETQLDDFLNAPEDIPREPFRVKVLRIGKVRDGSKTGALGYGVEHAREWQTPHVAAEAAARLLHNYNTDTDTKRLVDNLDIFVLPVINPDGHLYSYYDFSSQRKNLTNYCGVGENNDLGARNTWGVDVNRNYPTNSGFDGYSGTSTSCTSGTYRGPAELSEPEAANLHWLAGAFPNIKFSMNIHSSGNYFLWSPAAYITPGRIQPERPTFGQETFFFEKASQILTAVKQHRGLTVTPARTGPTSDVLYSAAGVSGDMLWYDFGVFAWAFETGTSFQPSWGDGRGEAYDQTMEFANGLVELFQVALDWTRDRYAPTSWINEDISFPSSEPVGITFGHSEPVDIYYTTDGSNPTEDSARYQFAGIREGGETLWFDETTTIKWFSVDLAGNVEGKYDPRRDNANTATIVITD